MSEQHPVLNKLPNTLSLGRMAFGVYQMVDLWRTDNLDYTWGDSVETALAAISDKIDGALALRSVGH